MAEIKLALICYHKNIENLYPLKWINEFRESIFNQTYGNFTIFEVCYGNDNYRIFDSSIYECKEFPTFVHAMNYLLDKAFEEGYDYVGNLNCDDKYSVDRIEKQLPFIKQGIDIISSNFCLLQDDEIVLTHKFDGLDIATNLAMNNNILCHPVIFYSKNFWKQNRYVPDEIPVEDMLLWQRGIKNGNTFIILPDVLCYHRLHDNSVCQNLNNR